MAVCPTNLAKHGMPAVQLLRFPKCDVEARRAAVDQGEDARVEVRQLPAQRKSGMREALRSRAVLASAPALGLAPRLGAVAPLSLASRLAT